MLPVEKVFDGETEATANSAIFNAQWYPKVTAQVKRDGGSTHTVKLEGSINGVDWEEVDAGGANITLLKSSTDWYHYFRIVLSGNDGAIDAWIGAGGA